MTPPSDTTSPDTRASGTPEPTSPRVRGHRKGTPSLAKPLGAVAVLAALVLAALILMPGLGGTPETYDALDEAAPAASEPTNEVEGQGAEPEGTGGRLEPGILPDVEEPLTQPVGAPAETRAE